MLLAGATALLAPSAAGAASGPPTFTGTIITDAAGGERHIVKSIVIATSSPRGCRFTASVQQTGEIAGGTGLFAQASGSGAGGVVSYGTAARAADGSCDPLAPTAHEVDRLSSTGTLSY
jgi:hypothetical protein